METKVWFAYDSDSAYWMPSTAEYSRDGCLYRLVEEVYDLAKMNEFLQEELSANRTKLLHLYAKLRGYSIRCFDVSPRGTK